MESTKNQTEECTEKVLSPLEREIISTASFLLDQGKPLHLLLIVDEKIFQEERKKDLEPMLRQYGEILSNYDFSHAIRIKIPDLETAKEIVEDYEAGRLEGIEGMELSSMDAVMCYGDRAA